MRIDELEELVREIFESENSVVSSVKTVKEKEENYTKIVISIHGLIIDEFSTIHTKFIFYSEDLIDIDNNFRYLYDINCEYHLVEFIDKEDLKNKIINIFKTNNFGEDIRTLSDFIGAPAMFLNYYLKKNNITDYSVFDVEYTPKFKIVPCSAITFDFKINIDDNYELEISLKKSKDDDGNLYKFTCKFMGNIETTEQRYIKNLNYIIGNIISTTLESKLKNK